MLTDIRIKEKLEKVFNTLNVKYGFPESFLKNNLLITNYNEFTVLQFLTTENQPFIIGYIIHKQVNHDTILAHLKLYPFCNIIFIYDFEMYIYKYIVASNKLENQNDFVYYKKIISSSREKMLPIDISLENIYFEAHSLIRDIDGLHADEALDEICKIIYTKIFDEENNNQYFDLSKYCCNEEIYTNINYLYKQANDYDNRVFSLRIPGYKRSRGVFDNDIHLSVPALASIVKLFSQYNFSLSKIDIKGRAFQKIITPAQRAGMGQYFTPYNIVEFVCNIVRPTSKDLILDPFCGSGHFLTQALKFVTENESENTDAKLISEFAHYKLHGIEKSDRMVRIAMTDMRLNGDGHSNIRCTDALLSFTNYNDLEENSFDIIMTNPPFGSILNKQSLPYLGEFELKTNKNKVALEILGLERCTQFLRENGKLAIILPDSIFVNPSLEKIRIWVKSKLDIFAIISLPIAAFSPFGANVKTSILFAKTKYGNKEQKDVFLGELTDIGYDASGKQTNYKEIKKMTELLTEFMMKRGW